MYVYGEPPHTHRIAKRSYLSYVVLCPLSFLFSLLGAALLALGLWMRFDSGQWAAMNTISNGHTAVLTYIGIGAAVFLLSTLGWFGVTVKDSLWRMRLIAIFQIGMLVLLVASTYGSVVLFRMDQTTAQQKRLDIIGKNTLTPNQTMAVRTHSQTAASFVTVVAASSFLIMTTSCCLFCEAARMGGAGQELDEVPVLPRY